MHVQCGALVVIRIGVCTYRRLRSIALYFRVGQFTKLILFAHLLSELVQSKNYVCQVQQWRMLQSKQSQVLATDVH